VKLAEVAQRMVGAAVPYVNHDFAEDHVPTNADVGFCRRQLD
jgi:hypothetical protein